ncbi:hypothetical protein [Aquibacillus albus]|uniref:ABC-type glycerol-3-phosphate transport system substrate-binding protein n=1 Tax=Aquibacillus albus TaxID=1168171 RepID=A0ABS2MWP6_9BACI|nr:hypothetical protein [Aquibacillus albus]MBM7570305.1 ABC-type glycerol-3-phosphate transport system substrate-binding protein [Aquibacillus albus]
MKKAHLFFLAFIVIILLSACGLQEIDKKGPFRVIILSDIPLRFDSDFDPYILEKLAQEEEELEDDFDVRVDLFPISHEKLTIEILTKEVDVFIVDESLKHILLDPYGLHPLDRLKEKLPSELYKEYIMTDEESGESHLYAIPLKNDSRLLQDLGIEIPSSLIAVVTSHSTYKERGIQLLEQLK